MEKIYLPSHLGTVTFTPGTFDVGTVVISGLMDFDKLRVLAVSNMTRNALLYSPEAGIGGTWSNVTLGGGTLTLASNTSTHNAADDIRVIMAAAEDEDNFKVWKTDFSAVISGSADSANWDVLQIGSGMTVNQANSALVVTTGTTVRSETILRSKVPFTKTLLAKVHLMLSQRIANQEFSIALADKIADDVSYSITNTTTVVVTFVGANPFTAQNVGQRVEIGKVTSTAGVPTIVTNSSTATIASISGLTTTFTVVGWPASGSGTLSIWGRNLLWWYLNGTSATTANCNSRRNGWQKNPVAASTDTTASPGLNLLIQRDKDVAAFGRVAWSTTGATTDTSQSTQFTEMVPEEDVPLYLIIRIQNGTTAPTSTTTATFNAAQVQSWRPNPVTLSPTRILTNAQSNDAPYVRINGTLPVSGTLSLNGGSWHGYHFLSSYNNNSRGNLTYKSANSANATVIRNTLTNCYFIQISNAGNTPALVRFYNKTTAPVIGTDTPDLRLWIPANSMQFWSMPLPLQFTSGMAATITGGSNLSDSDSTFVAADQVSIYVQVNF